MSVLIVGKFQGDTAKFRDALVGPPDLTITEAITSPDQF